MNTFLPEIENEYSKHKKKLLDKCKTPEKQAMMCDAIDIFRDVLTMRMMQRHKCKEDMFTLGNYAYTVEKKFDRFAETYCHNDREKCIESLEKIGQFFHREQFCYAIPFTIEAMLTWLERLKQELQRLLRSR